MRGASSPGGWGAFVVVQGRMRGGSPRAIAPPCRCGPLRAPHARRGRGGAGRPPPARDRGACCTAAGRHPRAPPAQHRGPPAGAAARLPARRDRAPGRPRRPTHRGSRNAIAGLPDPETGTKTPAPPAPGRSRGVRGIETSSLAPCGGPLTPSAAPRKGRSVDTNAPPPRRHGAPRPALGRVTGPYDGRPAVRGAQAAARSVVAALRPRAGVARALPLGRCRIHAVRPGGCAGARARGRAAAQKASTPQPLRRQRRARAAPAPRPIAAADVTAGRAPPPALPSRAQGAVHAAAVRPDPHLQGAARLGLQGCARPRALHHPRAAFGARLRPRPALPPLLPPPPPRPPPRRRAPTPPPPRPAARPPLAAVLVFQKMTNLALSEDAQALEVFISGDSALGIYALLNGQTTERPMALDVLWQVQRGGGRGGARGGAAVAARAWEAGGFRPPPPSPWAARPPAPARPPYFAIPCSPLARNRSRRRPSRTPPPPDVAGGPRGLAAAARRRRGAAQRRVRRAPVLRRPRDRRGQVGLRLPPLGRDVPGDEGVCGGGGRWGGVGVCGRAQPPPLPRGPRLTPARPPPEPPSSPARPSL
jgi:hypothetical protein